MSSTLSPPASMPVSPVSAPPNLVIIGLLLALSNFIVVLDTTIANVSVSHIAGSLAVSTTEGTYVITSYAVAEAITVPLTGWLATRFGTLRTFVLCLLLFGLFSGLCGLANSLGMLVFARILQGLAGGPLMPLSQTMMMQIFPPQKRGLAMAIWAMTTLIAPVLGPIIGGVICDTWSWPHIFYINIPFAVIASFICWRMLRPYETKTTKTRIDFVGLGLLIVWVAALQIMLDEGKNLDWFESNEIIILGLIAVIGFIAFFIWEMTDRHPVVNLRVFRHRGFSTSVLALSLAFGAFFGVVIITPLWLQNFMGYTSTWSGYTMAATGILAVFIAPIVAQLLHKIDLRLLTFIGISWLGLITFSRSFGTTDMTYFQSAFPLLLQGLGMPFFFIPLSTLALSSVNEEETADAAGMMSFLRTLSGAFATSITTTLWENRAHYNHAELASVITDPDHINPVTIDYFVQTQSFMLATNQVFLILAIILFSAAFVIWLAPRPTHLADPSGTH